MFRSTDFNNDIALQICKYAGYVAARGWVHNTLGNIALRQRHTHDPENGVLYTKHLGISLEEMTPDNVIVTDIPHGSLLFGDTAPSVGNSMNREILRCRPDVDAVLHLHTNETIAYFNTGKAREFRFISIDAPPVLAADVVVLDNNINVEADAGKIPEFIHKTNCFIMPNHGVTTVGRTLSEAYHRMATIIAEMDRITRATILSSLTGKPVTYLSDDEKRQLFEEADPIIYGEMTRASGKRSASG